jgi:hypothetical protein
MNTLALWVIQTASTGFSILGNSGKKMLVAAATYLV